MNKIKRLRIIESLTASFPNAQTELHYASPFQLLIAVILSAQTTDKRVNLVTPALFARADTAEAMSMCSEEEIRSLIATVGLYKNKAKFLHQTTRLLVERHQGNVPRDRAALEALPGVGRKTANVVLNTLYGDPTIAVDTHVFRVSRRIGLAKGHTVRAVEDELLKTLPPTYLDKAHHCLVLHGRYVCKAIKPQCHTCVIMSDCEYPQKTPAKC